MINILLSALCAVSLHAGSPADTVDRYVIDGEKIIGFDGSQLQNKIILKYTIDYRKVAGTVEKTHSITTLNSQKLQEDARKAVEEVEKALKTYESQIRQSRPLVIIDGAVSQESSLTGISPDEISSITVYKPSDKSTVTYNGEILDSGTVMVYTKNGKYNADIYVNGRKVSKEEYRKIDSKKVVSTNFETRDGATVIQIKTR